MKQYRGSIKTDKVGSDCYFEFEAEDDASPEEIEAEARDAAFEKIEWYFEEVKA